MMVLAYAGFRISEALALRARDVRLHAEGRRLDVLDAKAPTGVREVHLSAEPADVLTLYFDRRRAERSGAEHEGFLWRPGSADVDRGPHRDRGEADHRQRE